MDRGRLRAMVAFIVHVAKRYQQDRASSVAAALSYSALLSLVPLLAIALAMLAAFPAFGSTRATIERWVFANFVPAVGNAVEDQVSTFVANAGSLSAIGLIGLGISAVTMLITIESEFNVVFRVAEPRGLVARLLLYWSLVTLGPLLIGASLSIEGALIALNPDQPGIQVVAPLLAILAVPLPTLLSIAAFSLLFAQAPNRPVRGFDAVIGGAVAGLLFALLRWGFAVYITRSHSYATIYGAAAVVPITLLWMFLSWAVVLVGAEITAALPEWRGDLGPSLPTPLDNRDARPSPGFPGRREQRRRRFRRTA